MSWATCYSGTNNIHFNFPPIMADGRVYSSWQPESVVNKTIQKQENITSSWEYRQYLTHNATEIMKINYNQTCGELGLPSHQHSNDTPSGKVPYLFKSTYDTNTPGYGYSESDLKTPYLSREKLQSRMVAPNVSYPFDNSANLKTN